MTTLYGYVSNIGTPEYDDILNSDLSKEEKVKQIQMRGQAYRDEIDRNKWKDYARMGLGTAISAASFHPILNIPYVGTGLGGAMYELGQGMVEGNKLPEILKRTGQGFAVGETVGAVPYVGKLAGKTKVGAAVGDSIGRQVGKLADTQVGRKVADIGAKVGDVLMTDIKAFNPNKRTAYHGSPYDFNKFSNEAIGTGEGAQAHGMGHYAALNKDVSNRYAGNLANAKPHEITYKNQAIQEEPIRNALSKYKLYGEDYAISDLKMAELQNRAKAEKYKQMYPDSDYYKQFEDDANKYLEFANNIKNGLVNKEQIKLNNSGQLYKIAIPKDDVMLREDLPINQQPIMANIFNNEQNKTINRISNNYHNFLNTNEALGIDINRAYGTKYSSEAYDKFLANPENYKELYYPSTISGRDFYTDLANSLGGPKNASAELSKYGIKGIAYNGGIDGEARVIFNPDDIDIVRKYYNQPSLADYLANDSVLTKGYRQNKEIIDRALLNILYKK